VRRQAAKSFPKRKEKENLSKGRGGWRGGAGVRGGAYFSLGRVILLLVEKRNIPKGKKGKVGSLRKVSLFGRHRTVSRG